MRIPENLLAFLRKEKQFFIATHINPEADALGSSLALGAALESLGKKTVLYCKDAVPKFYRFLPGNERFIDSISNLRFEISNLLLLDCNDLERAGIEKIKFNCSAVIDHHETEKEFGDIKWIEPYAPATGLMVFYVINELDAKITKEIATNLYTAIAVDTGTFRYSNTTPDALRVAAHLIEAGADPSYIAENLYDSWSEERFRLLMKTLNALEINGNVAISLVTLDMFRERGATFEDTENFPNFLRMMKRVQVAALFKEIEKNFYKVSLRSRGETNVAKIAETFGGGGHRNAAGYRVRSDFKTAKEALLKALKYK